MRVLVTGSGGYIARGVIVQLLSRGIEVIAIGHRALDISHDLLMEVNEDVFDLDFSCFEKKPDALLHLAWRNGFDHSSMTHLEDLHKHYGFLSRAIDSGISHLAVMGSMHEVGYWEGAIDEMTPCNPTTPYGVAKNALRQLLLGRAEQDGITVQWLRGFYLCSNDGRGSSIFSKIVNCAKSGKKTFPFTSGKSQYDFLLYEEFCSQVVATITQVRVTGIINICSGKPIALKDYVEGFIRDNHLPVQLDYGRYPDRPYDSPAVWGDDAKIQQILGRRD